MSNLPRESVEDEALWLALGEAFSATLLGVSEHDLDVKSALGARLLLELRKRGIAVAGAAEPEADLRLSLEFG